MLQKLLKCEVKVARCGNYTICLPHRFYMKSNFGGFKLSKCYFWHFQRFWIFIQVNLSHFQVPNLPKFKVESLWNCKNSNFWFSNFAKIDFKQNWVPNQFLCCGTQLHILKNSGAWCIRMTWLRFFSKFCQS